MDITICIVTKVMIVLSCFRYDIVLRYPSQPLLRLKQSHNAHNLLVDFKEEGRINFMFNKLFIT